MDKRIIYQTEDGGVAVIVPSDNCGLSVEAIAKKDVPTGAKYKLVDVADVASESPFRNAREVNEAAVTDGVAE